MGKGDSYALYVTFSSLTQEDENGEEFLGGLDVIKKANANDQFIVLVDNHLTQTDALSGSSIQKLEDASGTVVNMDEFSVTVSKLPNGMNAPSFSNILGQT